MKNYTYLFILLFFCFAFPSNQTAETILLSALHKLDGISYSFNATSIKTGKKKKEKNYSISVYWPFNDEVLKKSRVKTLKSKLKNPSSFWEYTYKENNKTKRWMTLPISGKLKDISDKKNRSSEFIFSDLEFTDEEIKINTNILLSNKEIRCERCYVIKSVDSLNSQKSYKIIWIDSENYNLLKIEFYTGSGKMIKTIECLDFIKVDEVYFPANIQVNDLKRKSNYNIKISDFKIQPDFDLEIFNPRNL